MWKPSGPGEGRKALKLPVPLPSYNHWFDGMAMLHQFRIRDGGVTYMSRFLRSDVYKKNSEQDRIVISEFGTLALPDPCKNFFQRFLSRFEMIGEWTKRPARVCDREKVLEQFTWINVGGMNCR